MRSFFNNLFADGARVFAFFCTIILISVITCLVIYG